MTNPLNTEDTVDTQPKPTRKQLNLLRDLADETGQTFTYPNTCSDASAEIRRMLAIARSRKRALSRTDARMERKATARDFAANFGGATAFRDHELEGHGSTATWSEVA